MSLYFIQTNTLLLNVVWSFGGMLIKNLIIECLMRACNALNTMSSDTATAAVVSMFCLFVCSVALRTKSIAMIIAGRSVHLTTLFPGQA